MAVLNEEQEMLRDMAREWATNESPVTEFRKVRASGEPEAFDRAAHIVALDAVQNRLSPSSMEPRAALASYDPGRDEYTLYLASQNPHLIRHLTSRTTMPHLPETKLRVIAPDVGGGFGSKTPQYNEEYLCIYGAKATGRPVKWVSDRSEAFLSDAHGRDHVTRAEMAVDSNGKILAIRSSHVANLGAYARCQYRRYLEIAGEIHLRSFSHDRCSSYPSSSK